MGPKLKCPKCRGAGKVTVQFGWDADATFEPRSCSRCDGAGAVTAWTPAEQREVWVNEEADAYLVRADTLFGPGWLDEKEPG